MNEKAKCYGDCVHVEIEDWLYNLALEEDGALKSQKGVNNPTTMRISEKRDIIGSIAQNGVFHYVENCLGMGFEAKTKYYDPSLHKDSYDFILRGNTYDIKGSDIGTFPDGTPCQIIYPNTHHGMKIESKEKPMDFYVFCKVDLKHMRLHIAGVISFDMFWNLEQKKIVHGFPYQYVKTTQLEAFRKHYFRA
jgi:hypothetical protein